MTVANMPMIQAAPAMNTATGQAVGTAGRIDMGDFASVFSEKLAQKQPASEKPNPSAPVSEKPKTESAPKNTEQLNSESSSTSEKLKQSAQSDDAKNVAKPVESQADGEVTLALSAKKEEATVSDRDVQTLALVEAGELLSTLELLRTQTVEVRQTKEPIAVADDVASIKRSAEFDEEVAALLSELSDAHETLTVESADQDVSLSMQKVTESSDFELGEMPKDVLATAATGREPIETQRMARATVSDSVDNAKLSNDAKLLAASDMKLKASALSEEKISTPTSPNGIAAMVNPLSIKATEAVTPTVAASQVPQLPVHTPLTGNKWSQEIGTNLMIMASRRLDMAQMAITPPHLGPIDVALKVHQDQASVLFVAATPQAKEALEQSLPRLAAMLSENGLQLNDAHVSSGDSQEQRQAEQQAFLAQHGDSRDELAQGERFIDVAHTVGIPVERELVRNVEDLPPVSSVRHREAEPGRVSFFA